MYPPYTQSATRCNAFSYQLLMKISFATWNSIRVSNRRPGLLRNTANLRFCRVCIARLYGGGPTLHLPPELIPSASQPLTPAFSLSPNSPPSSLRGSIPAGHQAATPRFLLSLLATATFLGMPAAAAHALQLILASVGPFTAVRYLNFAIGKGIGPSEEEEDIEGVSMSEEDG